MRRKENIKASVRKRKDGLEKALNGDVRMYVLPLR